MPANELSQRGVICVSVTGDQLVGDVAEVGTVS
jgi:hypothetical protein